MRDGKGVEKGEDLTPNLGRFFKLWGRKFWKLISLNFFALVQIIPILGCVFLYLGGPKIPTQYDALYNTLLGAQTALPTTEGATLFNSAAGLLHQTPIFNSWAHWVMAALILFHLITYGWQKVGTTYILRNLVRGDGVFMFSDYFYAIKRNMKQGFIMGLIDSAAIFALVYDFMFFYNTPNVTFGNSVMYFVIFALILIYGIMRFYTYLMLVTFDMKLTKILKNALIFTVMGFGRNLLALLGMGLLTAIFGALILFLGRMLPAVIILPFLCLLGFCGFMYTFAAYPVIEKYMIAPPPVPVSSDTDDTSN
jgi:uncharacterized membrane protein YesL